ncbi:MAG: carbonic anhydrase [Ignavibacteriae bacterium]|nr:MAG: carbonic anhydrase [Ignavibacteriota bacterium]
MKHWYSFVIILVVTFLFFGTTTAQDEQERWSVPITKLKPTGETVQQPVYKEYIPSTEYRTYDTKSGKVIVGPNIRMHPTTYTTQSEMAVSLHPTNPNIVFSGSNAAGYPTVNWISQGWYITTNGGATWFGGDTLPPHQMAGMSNYTSDPVTAIDLNNNIYFNTILYSSTTGDIVVSRSSNWGQTWTPFTALPDPGVDEDKNWMAVDIDPGSPYAGNIYVAYTDFNSSGSAYRRVRYARSTNQGASFTPNPTINISGNSNYLDQGVNITTGPNGEVYICWTNYISSALTSSNVGFTRSTDGGVTFSTPSYAATNVADIRGTLVKGGNSIRVNSFPFIAADRSNGPYRGHIYIVYPAKNPTRPDIFIVKSSNGGVSWTAPTRVNQADNNLDQWFPSVAVDPATGFVYVVYYDSRNFPANDSAQVYLSRSTDGGQTFEDILVSDQAFLPKSISGLASGYMGDYIDVKALNGIVWPVWNDNRTGYHQAYTAKVIFGPTITHTPLPNTENLSGPYTVTAEITSSIPLDPNKIKVYWGRTGTITDSVLMTNTGGDIWTANIPGNGLPATYKYYIYAADNMGGFSTSPPGAPSSVHEFEVGIDNTPPTVVSSPLPDQYRETWPAKVSATVTDNIGIDSVWVEWKKNDEATIYKFRLDNVSGNLYEGYFNIDSSFFAVGDSVLYIVYAQDNSSNHNIGFTPPSGYYKFNFIPDTDFPIVTHTPLRNQPEIRWPASVKAVVTDNLGVDSVWVEYYLNEPVNTGKFYLIKTTGNNYEALWDLDTTQIQVGDSIFYKVVARDISNNQNVTYNPTTGEHKFYIISTKGLVLVVDDDGTTEKNEKGGEDVDPALKGVTGRLIQRTLTEVGYIVDTVSFAIHNPAVYPDYDIVVWTGGTKGTGVFGDVAKRDALRARVASGGKVWVEGGEVGYVYRWQTTELDKNFRQQVLHDSSWLSDVTSSSLVITQPTHPIFTTPNPISSPIAFTGTSIYSRDAVRLMPGDPGAYKIAGWSTYTTQGPDTCGIIVFDNNPNPLSAQIVFMTFALNSITDTVVAKKLIENTAEFLMTPEAPPSGAVVGTVTLTGTSDYSGVNVQLIGFNYNQTQVTGTTGEFSFTGLYPGNYTIKVWKSGYYPTLIQEPVVVGTGIVTLNYTLDPILPATVTGVVTLQGTTNYSGVSVEIVGQGLSTLTNTLGEYTITGITPGNIKVKVKKSGWKTAVKDTSVGNGSTLNLNFYLEVTPGNILVVDNDDFASRIRPPDDMRSGEQPDTIALGGSSRLFYNTLTEAGYNVDLVAATSVDTSSFVSYDVVIWSCGRAGTVIDNQTWRTALINRVNNGLPVLIEGGDVAYYYRVSGGRDPVFRSTVLRIADWLSDSPGNLSLENPTHPIATTPYTLPPSYTFDAIAGLYDKDGVNPLPDAQVIYGWTSATNYKGILAYGTNPSYGVGAFFPMNINNIAKAESTHAKNLIINTINFLKPPPPSSISGMKFNDLNGNGVKDEGEPPLANWKIKLTGTTTKSTFTDENGNYSFTNLMMGTYTISESLQVGWVQTYPSGGSYTVVLASGIDTSGFNFGNMQLNSISGMKFNDLNGNGIKDEGEVGLAGWKIYLSGAKIDSTLTNTNGEYSFNNLMLGSYTISEALQPGWLQTYPASPGIYEVTFTEGGTFVTEKDFGNYQLASISGIKFDDINANGVKDENEPVIEGWKIYLNGNADSVLTNENGQFSFSGLTLGTYVISEELQPGWVQTYPASPGTHTININSGGMNVTDKDFGNFKLGSISGMKFNDLNNNGLRDAGEPGIDNWKIYLSGAKNDSTLTMLGGQYSFDNLMQGVYVVSEEVQTGWVQTMPASGNYTIEILSGVNSAGNDFGNFFPADTVKYRTFVSDSLAQAKPVKMKPDKVKFCASFTNSSILADGIRIKFDQIVNFTDIDGFTSAITIDGGKTWDLRGRYIYNGEQVTVCGIGNKGKNIKIAGWWWIVSGSPTDKRDGFVPPGQQLLLPMPNWANARIETFNKFTGGIILGNGMVIGKAVPESATTYGWVRIKKQADMYKSIKDKSGYHTKPPRGFNTFENSKPFIKEQKNLPPSKHNNKLFAEALTLRFNIIASSVGIIPPGIGELVYDDGTANPLNGLTVAQIDSLVNHRLTFYKNISADEFANFYTTIKAINEAFAGPIDTVSTKPFVLTGIRQLRDVPYLKVSELPPFRMITSAEPVLPPERYRLGQNYPNPFNPTTTIEFDLPEEGLVTLKVYNLLGQEVATLLENEDFGEGSQEITFDAAGFASGVYFYRIIVKDYEGIVKFQSINKMVLLK